MTGGDGGTPVGAGDPDGVDAVAIVGAGAVGLATAAALAERAPDVTVTVYERGTVGDGDGDGDGDGSESGSSGRAAGICYDAYAEDVDAAVGRRALALFREAAVADGDGPAGVDGVDDADGFTFHDRPYVLLAREGDDRTAEALATSVGRMRDHGVDVALVDPPDLPTPIRTDDVAVAAVARNAGWVDPESFVAATAARARAAGVDVRTGTPVTVVGDENGRGNGTATPTVHAPDGPAAPGPAPDAVVVAAGAHTARLLGDAGYPVPVVPYRVQALTSATAYDGPMAFDATSEVYWRPHPTGLLAGDGTVPVAADPDDWTRAADGWFVAGTTAALRRRLAYDPDVVDAWAGLCTATPDGDPLVGERAPGLYVAAGWQGHGLMRAPAIGDLLARSLLGGAAPPAPFDPARFDGDESVAIRQGVTVDEEQP